MKANGNKTYAVFRKDLGSEGFLTFKLLYKVCNSKEEAQTLAEKLNNEEYEKTEWGLIPKVEQEYYVVEGQGCIFRV